VSRSAGDILLTMTESEHAIPAYPAAEIAPLAAAWFLDPLIY
jgi:hypothetical protein